MTVGKHCAHLDLGDAAALGTLRELLAGADIFIHGYRPDALDKFGLSEAVLRRDYPWLIDIGLDAYGWGGPWANRRGFDSLVQMSCGIADAGREHFGGEKPFPLPVQALDHATGYLCTAAAVKAWQDRLGGTVRRAEAAVRGGDRRRHCGNEHSGQRIWLGTTSVAVISAVEVCTIADTWGIFARHTA